MKIGIMVRHMIPDQNQIQALCLVLWASSLQFLSEAEQNLGLVGFFLGLPFLYYRTLASREDYKKKRRENNQK